MYSAVTCTGFARRKKRVNGSTEKMDDVSDDKKYIYVSILRETRIYREREGDGESEQINGQINEGEEKSGEEEKKKNISC
jgi:hypothetical protein